MGVAGGARLSGRRERGEAPPGSCWPARPATRPRPEADRDRRRGHPRPPRPRGARACGARHRTPRTRRRRGRRGARPAVPSVQVFPSGCASPPQSCHPRWQHCAGGASPAAGGRRRRWRTGSSVSIRWTTCSSPPKHSAATAVIRSWRRLRPRRGPGSRPSPPATHHVAGRGLARRRDRAGGHARRDRDRSSGVGAGRPGCARPGGRRPARGTGDLRRGDRRACARLPRRHAPGGSRCESRGSARGRRRVVRGRDRRRDDRGGPRRRGGRRASGGRRRGADHAGRAARWHLDARAAPPRPGGPGSPAGRPGGPRRSARDSRDRAGARSPTGETGCGPGGAARGDRRSRPDRPPPALHARVGRRREFHLRGSRPARRGDPTHGGGVDGGGHAAAGVDGSRGRRPGGLPRGGVRRASRRGAGGVGGLRRRDRRVARGVVGGGGRRGRRPGPAPGDQPADGDREDRTTAREPCHGSTTRRGCERRRGWRSSSAWSAPSSCS